MSTHDGKRALVTGGDGFIGSHLVEMLLARGYKVRALGLYNSFNFRGWLEQVSHENLEVEMGDIRDGNSCLRLTEDVDIVYHLAALIAIPYSYRSPDSYIDTNVKGTANICMAALKSGVKRIIHTSTSEVYGTARYVPIDEAHPLQPQSPYSASKIGADAMAMSYWSSFGLPLTMARPFNTYGPRQSARAIIPTIISQIASGAKVIKLGDMTPTRDLTYVTDTCKGFVELGESSENLAGEVVNIGSNYEVDMATLFQTIKELMNSDAEVVTDDERLRPAASEVRRLWCDNRKIAGLTGFQPDHSLREGLRMTIDWFLEPQNLKHYKPELYNV